MRLFKRLLLFTGLLIIIALIAGYIVLNGIKKSALPDYSEDLIIPGLRGEVTVVRDSFAVPHIYADNDEDLYLATGFVMAQDRLWQMDLLRRVTQGRLSEIMGRDQSDTDLLMRALRIEEKSRKVLLHSDPEIVKALNAFSEGVNYYIENFPLPPEFRILGYSPGPWLPVHSLNLIGYMSWDLTSGWDTELLLYKIGQKVGSEQMAELIPRNENHSVFVYGELQNLQFDIDETILSAGRKLEKMGVKIFSGSNNWAVSGEKSKSGKPLLANDMHLGLFAPGIWYQMHQVSGNSLNVTGLAVPGQPFVICGHNDSIAWGMTNVYVDDLDFYAETLNKDSTRYFLDGEWKPLLIKNEIIKTKEGEDISEVLKFTHRGPLVNRFKDEDETAFSIRWIGNEMSNEMETIYRLNRANNWQDFRNALKTFISISQNIAYADVAGNIGLQCSAGIPIRATGGINIFPGDTTLYDWRGLVPFEELPFEYNPERGYVSSANNKTVSEDYPYEIGYWYHIPDRIDRIREMLKETEKHSVEDFERIQSDFISKKAEKIVPEFLNVLTKKTDWNEPQKSALKMLREWDFNMNKDNQAASVFEIMYHKTGENLVNDELSPELLKEFKADRLLTENLILNILPEKNSGWTDNKNTPEKETFDDLVMQSFEETVEELEIIAGPDPADWQWGKIHTFKISHPLAAVSLIDKVFKLSRGPFGLSGSYHTICPYSYSLNNKFKVNHGASHRHIFDLADWDNSKTVIPTGTSGIPASEHYLDQTGLYIANRYHSDPFNRTVVLNRSRYKMQLIPMNVNPE